MSKLRQPIAIWQPNGLGGSTLTDIPAGSIAEPYISWIIAQYPFTWYTLIDLNDTDTKRGA
jgi:hypothetical protein